MFRKATEEDIHLIQTLAEQSWRENYLDILSCEQIDYMLDLMYSEAEISAQLKNPNYYYYIISDTAETAVGFLGFEHSYTPKTTKLHRIYLLKKVKGQGLGKESINFLKEIVNKKGEKKIILNVNKENPALKFYEAQQFKIYEEGKFGIGKGFVMDDFLMEYIIE